MADPASPHSLALNNNPNPTSIQIRSPIRNFSYPSTTWKDIPIQKPTPVQDPASTKTLNSKTVLQHPKDHAIISIRMVMTELLRSNNVIMAHELVHCLAQHLTTNDDKIHRQSDGVLFMSLYPTWYRNGCAAPIPQPSCRAVAAVTLLQSYGGGSSEQGNWEKTQYGSPISFQEAARHLLCARSFFEAAGLLQAADACVVFGMRYGW